MFIECTDHIRKILKCPLHKGKIFLSSCASLHACIQGRGCWHKIPCIVNLSIRKSWMANSLKKRQLSHNLYDICIYCMVKYWFEWWLKVKNVAFSACLYFKIKQVLGPLVWIAVLQYLELRFGQVARLAASISFSLQMILYMGIVLYAPALALEAVSGISKSLSVWIIGLVCTFYSTIGGMKAVIFTDVFQVCENFLKGSYFVYFQVKKRTDLH